MAANYKARRRLAARRRTLKIAGVGVSASVLGLVGPTGALARASAGPASPDAAVSQVPSSLAAPDDFGSPANPEAVTPTAADPGIAYPLDHAMGGPIDVASLIKAYADQLGSSYAGAWLDNSGPKQMLRVATTGRMIDSASLAIAPTAASGRVAFEAGLSFNYADLMRVLSALNDQVTKIDPSETTQVAVGLSLSSNRVTLSASPDDSAVVAELLGTAARLGLKSAVSVTYDSGHWESFATSQSRGSYPPYQAGLGITRTDYPGQCTGGFVWKGSLFGEAPRFFESTAGHCGTNDCSVTQFRVGGSGYNQSLLGCDAFNPWAGNGAFYTDSMLISNFSGNPDPSPKVYINSTTSRWIAAAYPKTIQGVTACHSGIHTAGCFPVTHVNVSFSVQYQGFARTMTGADCMDVPLGNPERVVQGDSGAPVYVPITGGNNDHAYALGQIFAGRVHFDQYGDIDQQWNCFYDMNNLEGYLDDNHMTLVTN